jgi:hypothetical protein
VSENESATEGKAKVPNSDPMSGGSTSRGAPSFRVGCSLVTHTSPEGPVSGRREGETRRSPQLFFASPIIPRTLSIAPRGFGRNSGGS